MATRSVSSFQSGAARAKFLARRGAAMLANPRRAQVVGSITRGVDYCAIARCSGRAPVGTMTWAYGVPFHMT